MANDDHLPTVRQLQAPVKLSQALKDEQRSQDDCLACRIVGSGALLAAGTYTFISGQSHLNEQRDLIMKSKRLIGFRTRQSALTATALSFIGLGLYRLVN